MASSTADSADSDVSTDITSTDDGSACYVDGAAMSTSTSSSGTDTTDSSAVAADAPYFTLILIHFSLRYTDAEIIKFFLTESGFHSVVARTEVEGSDSDTPKGGHGGPPADIVLWLDSRIVQLDVS